MDLNKVMLIGRLTQNPQARTTPQGVTVTTFGLATNRVWKDQQGTQQDRTEYHNIVAWRRLGEICAQYLAKGRQIYIEGHLQTRNWQDQGGQKRYRTEVVADNMIMLGGRSDTPFTKSTPASATAAAPDKQEAPITESEPAAAPVSDEEIRIEDIPF
jgi:single-strand DNA-binding protein